MLTTPNPGGARGHTGRDDEGGSGINIVSVVNHTHTQRDDGGEECSEGGSGID